MSSASPEIADRSRSFNFSQMSFDGTLARAADTGYIGADITSFKKATDIKKTKNLALETDLGIVPVTKMIHVPAHMVDRKGLKDLIVYALNKCIDRLGDNFDLCTPGVDISLPPYFGYNMPVVRVIVNGFLKRCKEGAGGLKNQYADIFYTDANSAKNIQEFIANVSSEYRKYMQKHIFAESSVHRAATISFPWSEKQEMTNVPEDREKTFVLSWVNIFKRNYKKEDKNSPDQASTSKEKVLEAIDPHLTRDLKIIHFASMNPLPDNYEQSRDPNHANCVSEFEKHLNSELNKLHNEGWDIKHYQLVQKPRTTLPVGLASELDQIPLNHFFAIIQCERLEYCQDDPEVVSGTARVGDRMSVDNYPRRQVRVVADTMKYTETVPNFDAQQAVAEPLNNLARDPNEPLREWNSTVVTYGYNPQEKHPEAMVRAVHSVMLKEPDPENDEAARASKIKNIRWNFRVFRGPHSEQDPSNTKPEDDAEFDRESGSSLRESLPLLAEHYDSKQEGKKAVSDLKREIAFFSRNEPENISKLEELGAKLHEAESKYQEIKKKIKEDLRNSEKHNIELLRYKLEAERVHEWDWMMEGAIAATVRDSPYELKAIVSGRQYLDHNFTGGVQGFHGTMFVWCDITRPNLNLVDL